MRPGPDGHPRFHALPAPDDAEVVAIAGRIATDPNAGPRVPMAGIEIAAPYPQALTGPRCANLGGFSLHANVAVGAADRAGLERLCRYAGRGPLATERLTRRTDGRLVYRLKRPWANGATHVIFNDLELLDKLAALVPPPRFHWVRYHRILAPGATWRPQIVPVAAAPGHDAGDTCGHAPGTAGPGNRSVSVPRSRNYSWAQLMARVFAIDVLECPQCGGPLRVLAAIQSPEAIRKILDCLALPHARPAHRPGPAP